MQAVDAVRPGSYEPPVAPELCPGGRFLVPKGTTRTISVPALPAVPDPLFSFSIASKDGPSLCRGQYVSGKVDAFDVHSNTPYDAYISMLSLDDSRELATIVIGRPPGSQHTEVHFKYGSGDVHSGIGFGILKKSMDPVHPFVLDGVTSLKVTVNGGQTNRTVRLYAEDASGWHERACATAYVTGDGQAWYEVECYELCDMLLASLTIMGVDRIDASNLVKLNHKSWL